MITKTKFSNLKMNASFYISNSDELFIKNKENGYWDSNGKTQIGIIPGTEINCDDTMLVVKPLVEVKPKKYIVW